MEFGSESPKLIAPRQHLSRANPVIVVPYATSVTLDGSRGNKFRITLAGNIIINAINWYDDNYLVHLLQDSAGNRSATWGTTPVNFLWPVEVTPSLTATALKRDLFSFTMDTASDGTRVAIGSFLKQYAK